MKQLLAELGIEIVKAEGAELICTCPFCEKPKLYVNIESGLWQCWRGCDQGNALTLARHLSNASDKDIFEKLNRIGLAFTDKRQAYVNDPQKKPRVASTDLQPMSEQDWQRLCQAKDLDRSHVEALEAFRHYGGMIAFIPAFDPEDRDHACGWIRVHLDGKLIETKYGSQKYPVEEGSQPGLIGLRTMTGEGPLVFCEGWKDMIAARALGFDSLTNSQGVKTWRESWGSMFQDREVWVCFDRDEAGTKSAPVIADHIKRYAKQVKIVELPYECVETGGRDLHDYVKDGHTREQFKDLVIKSEIEQLSATPKGSVLLLDDLPDTIAIEFEKQSPFKHRYHPIEGWSMFKNGQYQEIDEKTQLRRYISQFMARCVYVKREKYARVGLSETRIKDVIREVSNLESVYLLPRQESPCSLDGTLDSRHIIPLANGLLDWSVWPPVLHPQTDQYYTRQYLPYAWEGKQHSDLWDNFIASVTMGDQDLADLLQTWAGYCLMKYDQTQQKFLIVYGEAGTGKSKYIEVLTALLGHDNVSSVPLNKFDDPAYLYTTYGKMLNATDESEAQLEAAVETSLKQYVSGGQFLFKRLYKDSFTGHPTAKVMVATNHLPRFKDTSNGIWRRILIAPFDHVVPEDQQVKDLSQQIIKTSMPAVLYWALQGAVKLQESGQFPTPLRSIQALQQYKRDALPEIEFLESNFVPCSPDLNAFAVPQVQFRKWYKGYCETMGVGCKSSKHLLETARKMFPDMSPKTISRGGNRIKCWAGIAVSEDSELYSDWAGGRS